MDPDRVLIFDTTLRDGEQSPGISLNTGEKLEIAHQLARLGVDIIEAGFPIASPGDFEAVQAIAREVAGPGHRRPGARPRRRHRPCLGGGARRRATSHPHLPVDVGHPHRAPAAVHARGRQGPGPRRGRARAGRCARTSSSRRWTPRAPTSSSPPRCSTIAIDEGATTINMPDTVGYTMPDEYAAFLTQPVRRWSRSWRDVVLSVHCHDDLGLAVANSFAGIQAGARQVECAINGIGERAGNASLEEIVMLLHTAARGRRRAHRRSSRPRSRARAASSRA